MRVWSHGEEDIDEICAGDRERAVRMVLEHQGDHGSQWAAIGSIAAKIGCTAETLRGWVRQAERDSGLRAGPTSEERDRIKALEREVRELRQANDPPQGLRIFCDGGARPPIQVMKSFIDEHRDAYGVEPICRVLPIAPLRTATCRPCLRSRTCTGAPAARSRLGGRGPSDWNENFQVYGVRKIGGSSHAKDLMWRAAPSHGLCGRWGSKAPFAARRSGPRSAIHRRHVRLTGSTGSSGHPAARTSSSAGRSATSTI